MIVSDYEKFSLLMADVHGFYQRDVSDFALSVWWEAMRPFDFAAVAQALNRHVMNPDAGQFMPKPADIVRILQGTSQDSALVAWAKVDKAVRHVGTYMDVVFDDPLIHRAIHDMGGWIALGNKTEDEWPFVAKEFENRYRGFKSRGEIPEYPAKLIGMAGAHNEKEGFAVAEPVLIGNKSQAERVLAGGADKPMIGFTRPEIASLRLVEKREAA